jgi:hypothetical protein
MCACDEFFTCSKCADTWIDDGYLDDEQLHDNDPAWVEELGQPDFLRPDRQAA